MRFPSHVRALCLVGAVGLMAWPTTALAEESSLSQRGVVATSVEAVPGSAEQSSSSGGVSVSLARDPLVIEGVLAEGELLRAQEEARLASPESVRLRAESQTAYESLSVGESEEVDGRAFSSLAGEPGGGLRGLPEGDRVSSYSSPFSAVLELPGGRHGVVESVSPIAVEGPSSGQLVPVDLAPRQAGSGFEAVMPPTGMHVRVGDRLGEGASFSDSGVSLVPVTEDGTPLEADGVIDGAGVFYGDSEDPQTQVLDMDSFIKIGDGSFSEDTMLRSRRSPHKLYF